MKRMNLFLVTVSLALVMSFNCFGATNNFEAKSFDINFDIPEETEITEVPETKEEPKEKETKPETDVETGEPKNKTSEHHEYYGGGSGGSTKKSWDDSDSSHGPGVPKEPEVVEETVPVFEAPAQETTTTETVEEVPHTPSAPRTGVGNVLFTIIASVFAVFALMGIVIANKKRR